MNSSVGTNLLNRRKYRRNYSFYRALVTTPQASPLVLPATALFALVRRSGSAAVGNALIATGSSTRTIGVPAMAVGDIHQIGILQKDSSIALAASFDLYVNNGIGKYVKIAAGA